MTGFDAGGFIQITYFGWVTVGGITFNHLTGYFGTALVIMSEQARKRSTLAIPIGLLGTLSPNPNDYELTICHRGDKYAETGNFSDCFHASNCTSHVTSYLRCPAFC